MESSDKPLYFIVGIGRSGTTILNKLLNDHEEVHCLPEANFALFFLNEYMDHQTFRSGEIELIFQQIHLYSLSHPWVGWTFELERTKSELLKKAASGKLSYAELCKIIYSHFEVLNADKTKASVLIDKNPSYTLYADKLIRVFPEAKFVFLLRDYRANVLSRKQSIYIKSPDVSFNAFRWLIFNEHMKRFADRNSSKVHIVRYEDLVTDPDKTMLKLFQFLGVEPRIYPPLKHPETSDFESFEVSEVYKERFDKKYRDLGKPLNTGRLDSWKTQLSATEIKIADAICADFSKKIGYKAFFKLNWLQRSWIKIKCFKGFMKAYWDIQKDRLIYYAPISYKLKRLKQSYQKLGFIK